jgi:glucan 1,3-beta-glucosidase
MKRIILPLLALLTVMSTGPARAAQLPRLAGKGTAVAELASGKPVTLKGCNLGNWLLLEPWMQRWDIADQQTIIRTLADRFGDAKADELMEAYRAGYITPRDFELVKSFHFNLVRLPFESLLLADEQGKMRPDAFKWLDRALEMAEAAEVYVIIDMHGAPGRQSRDQCSGERGRNQLLSDPACQQRMIDLWTRIAQRYKDRSVVAGYDLLNEPYDDYERDVRATLRELSARCYKAIRSTGDTHLIIFPNALGRGVTFYGDVQALGMTQVAFTDHYYPGLFGSPSTLASHAALLARRIPQTAAYLEHVGSPMLVGEFNVALEKCGGDAMMRRYYDEFARRGWMATMWSYKLLKPAGGVEADNWYMVTNAAALPALDIRTAPLDEIQKYISSLATMPLAVDEKLRDALTSATAPPITLPPLDPLPEAAPTARSAGAWKLRDVGTSQPSGVSESPGQIAIVAGGSDIYSTRDTFAFLAQSVPETATLVTTLNELANSDTYAKAGLMLRFGEPGAADYASAPFVMVHAFPDGGLAMTVRPQPGKAATESKRCIGPLPRRLALVRDHAQVDAFVDNGADGWVKLGSATLSQPGPVQGGVAVCSHADGLLTRATVRDLSLSAGSHLTRAISPHANPATPTGRNLLVNESFENDGGWHFFGNGTARSDSAEAARTGKWALVSSAGDAGNAGAWQDVPAQAGKRYAFTVFVHRDDPVPAGNQNVSIALEATAVAGRQIALAEHGCALEQIESTGGWSLLRVSACAISDHVRVLIRPAPHCIIDDARLIELED